MSEEERSLRRVVIVGASLAGLRAAQAARKAGFDGEVVVVGDEPHLPYTRPPLASLSTGSYWPTRPSRLRAVTT